MLKRLLTLTCCLFLLLNFTQSKADTRPFPIFNTQKLCFRTLPDDILGVWWSPEKDGQIEFYKKNGKYFGKLIWSAEDRVGKPKLDSENPVESMRARRLVGADFFSNLEFVDGKWDYGLAYDPRSGYSYSCYLWLESPGVLKVRGFLGFSVLGKTVTMHKVK